MSQFTPGPWKVIRPGHLHPTEYLCVQIGADESYTTSELKPADARLIAAAPNLLEACQIITNGATVIHGDGFRFQEIPESHLRVVIDAIAKATGKGQS